MPIIIIEDIKIPAMDVQPGLYGSVTIDGEMLVKTHDGAWYNTEGTNLNPVLVRLVTVYDDPTEQEIDESRIESSKHKVEVRITPASVDL